MEDEPSRPPFWRAYAITVASFSLNFMTPMVNVGGEPFKIPAVAPWLGLRRAAGSVVIYQMLHTLGMLLSFLTAVVLGALLLPPYPAMRASLALAFVVLAALVLLLLTGHRHGGLERLLDLLHRIPLLGLDPALGVYTAIVSRLRDLVWIGGGLALVWFSGRRAQQRAAAP